jgi:WD40 repeat protein
MATFNDEWGSVQTLIFSPDGKLLASPRWGGGVRLWDVNAQKTFGDLRGHRVGVRDVRFAPNGKTIATAGYDGTARLWDLQTQRELAVLRPLDRASSVAFLPDGQRLAIGGEGDTVSLWDTSSQQQLATLAVPTSPARGVEWMEFHADGNTLLLATKEGMLAWRAPSFEEIARAEKPNQR